jgi:hypothetical protein
VKGCVADLTKLREYNQRFKICSEHQHAETVMRGDEPLRFCQQCARLQPLADFDGKKRSCRISLEQLSLRYGIIVTSAQSSSLSYIHVRRLSAIDTLYSALCLILAVFPLSPDDVSRRKFVAMTKQGLRYFLTDCGSMHFSASMNMNVEEAVLRRCLGVRITGWISFNGGRWITAP